MYMNTASGTINLGE